MFRRETTNSNMATEFRRWSTRELGEEYQRDLAIKRKLYRLNRRTKKQTSKQTNITARTLKKPKDK